MGKHSPYWERVATERGTEMSDRHPSEIHGFSFPRRAAERVSAGALVGAAVLAGAVVVAITVAPWAAALWLALE